VRRHDKLHSDWRGSAPRLGLTPLTVYEALHTPTLNLIFNGKNFSRKKIDKCPLPIQSRRCRI